MIDNPAILIGAGLSAILIFLIVQTIHLAGGIPKTLRSTIVIHAVVLILAILANAIGRADGGPPNFDHTINPIIGGVLSSLADLILIQRRSRT